MKILLLLDCPAPAGRPLIERFGALIVFTSVEYEEVLDEIQEAPESGNCDSHPMWIRSAVAPLGDVFVCLCLNMRDCWPLT